ncbi:MAG: hypothetical protein U1F43_38210 [Myxococcota bacterium]
MITMLAGAAPARADDLHRTGASPCTLVEGIAAADHPVRKGKAVAASFAALDHAGFDVAKNAKAYEQFVKSLDGLYAAAEKAFKAPAAGKSFVPTAAQRFLAAHVLAANAPLRVGLDGFEPGPEVAAAMALAACRAGRYDDAIDLGRRATLPESGPLRAFAALLLLERGDVPGARELDAKLGEEGFLAPFVAADLAPTAEERLRLHALAGRRRTTPDQDLAWQLQTARLQ